ncbi:hypothetical protein TTHERM_00129950 (macronuclear) [Tetrahymena thermophila SB210]|uniref:Cyclic nucleotide-binding domain protein n=1 Tax=Tetrahymena thermophila (strain SB210) TaxID=312017 RepID=I7LUX3_TETTS|nr:hypothetical protein TTHERM_00129950 [Tetrahymena thermophila SB210]EAR96218.2 hypothetical protein TTHERM_00129950 [Tetrahymena thermophila SB210]|eukprot:XP_001016463.2 hypothetical protein TTHERM_00129950 [Tetrahymena thermophila SB210]
MIQQINKFYKFEQFIFSQSQNEEINLELLFKHIQITDEDFQTLTIGLGSLKNLILLKLGLDENHIGEDGLAQLGKELGNCQNLCDLNISLNDCQSVSDEGISYLIEGLVNCTKIKNLALGLSNNQISQEGASNIGKDLQRFLNLTSLALNLSQNQIFDQGAADLAFGLGKCVNLTHLELNFEEENNISDIGASSIGAALANYLLGLNINSAYSKNQLKLNIQISIYNFNFTNLQDVKDSN